MCSALGETVIGILVYLLDALKINLTAKILLEGIPVAVGHAAAEEPADQRRADIVVEIRLIVRKRVQLLQRELQVRAGLYIFRNIRGHIFGQAVQAELRPVFHVHHVLPGIIVEINDAERGILEAELVGGHAFRKRLLHQL